MLVLAKEFHGGSYATVQDHFSKHCATCGHISNMMMVVEDITAARSMIYILLPNDADASGYEGFEIMSEDKLPKEASLLEGYQPDFKKRFQFPSRV